ncbi:hypothetical protein ACP3WT_24385, partial [Salmonella enterica]|uniref:hypothetical protein n=1 Tax=Salmonella enterica TaxID=28901 RepID=UPI003CEB5AAF
LILVICAIRFSQWHGVNQQTVQVGSNFTIVSDARQLKALQNYNRPSAAKYSLRTHRHAVQTLI